ncbi:MAG TPA: cyclic nucleotide-binding domain-containing protein [Thermoanaerobaculia bacterium]|nr:cyclic nucleotide-binding domain-containing protein [Thermoanaerobaculia bacterium]
MIKSWFNRGERELTIDELFVLERYEEAEARLRAQLRLHGDDRHSRAKLAEVLSALGRSGEAVAEYSCVADLYRDDGFYDKAAALLLRAIKLDPKNEDLRTLLTRVEHDKSSARNRQKALDALRRASTASGSTEMHFVELQYLWERVAETPLFDALPADQIGLLLRNLRLRRLGPDETLKLRGDDTPSLFIVGGGSIETRVRRGERVISVATHAVGEIVGESSLFERKPWPADTRAQESSVVLELTLDGLEAALAGNANPRALIDALRAQQNDRKLRTCLQELGA